MTKKPVRRYTIDAGKFANFFKHANQKHRQHSGLRLADFARDPRFVVATDDPIRPGPLWDSVHVSVDTRLERERIPWAVEKNEIEREVKARTFLSIKMANSLGAALHFSA